MFRRASSSGPENRLAACLIPAFSTLIRLLENITANRMRAATASATI
jgi:hypothetical protein